MRSSRCCKMAELVNDDVSIVAKDGDLGRISSQSSAVVGSLDKLDAESSVQCNGMSTVDLTDIDCRSSGTSSSGFGVNNFHRTPGVSNATVVIRSPVSTLTTCAPCVTAVRTDTGSIIVGAGGSSRPMAAVQQNVGQTVRLLQPNNLTAPPVANGRLPNAAHPSSVVTMLMRPSATSPGTMTPQLRLGWSPGGATVPASSVQIVNVGVANRAEPTAPRLVAVTSGVMPAGVRFIQSSLQQPQLQQQQVIAS